MFSPASGDLLGVFESENTLAFSWNGPGRIIASFSQRGNSIAAHFASNKEGLRHIKSAINDFCLWAFNKYEWCTMILAQIKRPSVARLVAKCGFKKVGDVMTGNVRFIYMRVR